MGAGASADLQSKLGAASQEELSEVFASLPDDAKQKVLAALPATEDVRTVDKPQLDNLRILKQQAYFHPSMGRADQSKVYAQTKKLVEDYCTAASNKHNDNAEAQVALFAEDGTFTMEDPVGTPVKTTKQEIRSFLSALPECSVTPLEIILAPDESQCAALLEFTLKGGMAFKAIDTFKLNEAGKIIEQRAYFHPSMGQGKKTLEYANTERLVQAYCAAASNKHKDSAAAQVALFAEDEAFTMEDPVGSPVKTTREAVKSFLCGLPACSVTAKEIIIAPDESQCAAVLEFALEAGPVFMAIDTFKLG